MLKRVRRHLSYVSHLLDANKMLIEHRRLLTVGGWLSLLIAAAATAAEPYARQVLARLESAADGPFRPRRAVSARLDLALDLLAADQPDEAGQLALTAMTSGVLVPSNYWRASEVIGVIETRHMPEATELREAYRELSGPK